MGKLLAAIAAAGAAIAARGATADACTAHGTVHEVIYWDNNSAYNPPVANDTRCNQTGGGQTCQLDGYYITPVGAGSGKLPTIIFVHGSGKSKPLSDVCVSINPFLDAGYVVFVPVMRGVSGSAPGWVSFDNTGAYVSDWADTHATDSCGSECQTIGYMYKESIDLDSAVHWLLQAYAFRTDLTRIALMGHSYGGIVSFMAASSLSLLTYKPTVTVDLSGAALSWAPGSDWEDALNTAGDLARSPVYFQQVVNESPIAPDIGAAVEAYDHVVWAGKDARLAAYSAYTPLNPNNGCNDHPYHAVHCAFVWEPAAVALWAPGVLEFLADHGMKP